MGIKASNRRGAPFVKSRSYRLSPTQSISINSKPWAGESITIGNGTYVFKGMETMEEIDDALGALGLVPICSLPKRKPARRRSRS